MWNPIPHLLALVLRKFFLRLHHKLVGFFFDKHIQLLYDNIMNGDIYHAVFCLQVENLLDIVAVVDEVLIKTSDVWTVVYNNHSIKIQLDVVPIIHF